MAGYRIKKDENGNYRLFHVGVELPGVYPAYNVAQLAFKLPDETLITLRDASYKKTGSYRGLITYKDVALELAKETHHA